MGATQWDVYLKPSAVRRDGPGAYDVRSSVYKPTAESIRALLEEHARGSGTALHLHDRAVRLAESLRVNIIGGVTGALLETEGFIIERAGIVTVVDFMSLTPIYPDFAGLRTSDPQRFEVVKRNNEGTFVKLLVGSPHPRPWERLSLFKETLRQQVHMHVGEPGQTARDNILHVPRDYAEKRSHACVLVEDPC